ncbi:uncharacterized protein LOC113505166 [Trichoplusia ni]|uniref:Uncharacterized protein LOC113505166 n=1 Tax=Trichoplusia ni TaxID=7111 RepID=A0A7E5WRX0_TRINI|nr:uncharacterized protein LOC113505166 [Trichoplusia ni]
MPPLLFDQETMQQFAREMAAGDMADLIGSNPHTKQPNMYNDLARRFVSQYKYTEVLQDIAVEPEENELIPVKAPPELVLVVAKESALLRPDKSEDLGDEVDRLKILRSGDYWNGVWKEDVDPKSALRMGSPKKVLGSIKAKIRPGSEFYKVVSRMKKISPRLLYIINKKKFA